MLNILRKSSDLLELVSWGPMLGTLKGCDRVVSLSEEHQQKEQPGLMPVLEEERRQQKGDSIYKVHAGSSGGNSWSSDNGAWGQ